MQLPFGVRGVDQPKTTRDLPNPRSEDQRQHKSDTSNVKKNKHDRYSRAGRGFQKRLVLWRLRPAGPEASARQFLATSGLRDTPGEFRFTWKTVEGRRVRVFRRIAFVPGHYLEILGSQSSPLPH